MAFDAAERHHGVVAVLIVLQMVRIQASAEAEAFREQADAFKGGYRTYSRNAVKSMTATATSWPGTRPFTKWAWT
jgi:hypothetical protein